MPAIDRHRAGDFCWVELGTTNTAAAKKFYSGLFGWNWEDMPMGEGRVYSMLKLQGRDIGAMYDLDTQAQQTPPHWLLYVASDNVDRAASQVSASGGRVLFGPFDVSEAGRTAVFQDPQGASFGIWQARQHPGIRLAGEPGTFGWPELATTDADAARTFYGQLFGWSTKDNPGYSEWVNQGRSIGGLMAMGPEWGSIPPHWMPYFQVLDCDATTRQARESGGGVRVPPTDIPDVGRFSLLHDPQGAHFSLLQLQRRVAAG